MRERYPRAIANLVALLPHAAHVQVYDNRAEAAVGASVPDPHLVLDMKDGRLAFPPLADRRTLARTPDWARSVVEAAATPAARAASPGRRRRGAGSTGR